MPHVSDEDFVVACVNNKSISGVAKELGMAECSVQQRRCRMRKVYGIALPEFPRGGKARKLMNKDVLNRIIANATGQSIARVRCDGEKLKQKK